MTPRTACLGLTALLLAGITGCTSVSDDEGDLVNVTVQALHQKRSPSGTTLGGLIIRPSRYAYAELRRDSDSALLATVGLNGSGTGTGSVPRGSNVYAVVYADILAPNAAGTGFALHGSVKKAIPQSSYATGVAFDAEPTWYTTSPTFTASSAGTLSVLSLESNSEAGAFAIADQMVEFALGMGRLEPTLPLPNLHTFWTSGTGSTYPAAVTTAGGALLSHPYSTRPILAHELWYGGPANCADAYNESFLQETFARSLFANGSYWSTSTPRTYGSIIRGDADAAYIDPGIASESTIAFANGFGYFLSGAFRNDPNLYLVASNGSVSTWSLNTSTSPTPVGGGEFYGASVARSLWGIWKNSLGGAQSGLQTLWDATVPSRANLIYEYGNAPLGCYPTYLVGLKRLAGSTLSSSIQTQLSAENIGDINSLYFAGTALWITVPVGGAAQTGSLTTYDNANPSYRGVYYDRDQAQAYRFEQGGGARTLTLSGSQPLILELFDSYGFLAEARSISGQPGVISFTNLAAGTYVARVRLNPSYNYTGTAATYSLSIN